MKNTIRCDIKLSALNINSMLTTWKELIDFIGDIDKQQQDVGFTEDLIKMLVLSLRDDYTAGEMNELLEGLKFEE